VTGPHALHPALSRASVDRTAQRRTDADWLAERWSDDTTKVIVVAEGRALVDEDGAQPRLVLVGSGDVAHDAERYFLGTDDAGAYFAAVGPLRPRIGARALGLREVGAALDDRDAGLFVHAVALANWHEVHTHCARCGAPTVVELGGHLRRCPADGSEHFPRTDPAVIMLVHDGADSCVLGRQPGWPPRFYSTLAGFVDPGESAEAAVVREVSEEVGLSVTDVTFRGSQPWPFPSSLMLGFRARADGRDALTIDGAELADARWFTKEELRKAVAGEEVMLPPPVSIAWHLITEWVDG
jgi:NAD+ diphosphatase